MVEGLAAGEELEVNDTETYDNGVKVVPAYLLEPQIVTKENAADAYADDPTLAELTK
jgi:putative multiple sugar transport system substrate-binding protein